MSEPVGHSPRTSEISNNSHKARERQPIEAVPVGEKEELQSIVTGKVTIRKPPWYKRLVRNMIAEDAASVGDYIMLDVIIPGFKRMMLDMLTTGGERVLFGAQRTRRESNIRGGGSIRNRYERMYEEPRARSMSYDQRSRHEFDVITLESYDEALNVIDNMGAHIARYGSVSVAELFRLLGVVGSFADQGWGWTDISGSEIRHRPDGYWLDLPRPRPLRD